MHRGLVFFVAVVIAGSAPPLRAQADAPHDHGESAQLGTVKFPVSCNASAQAHFTRGVSWLHSFEYEDAERSFLAASAADSTCAMSRWGVAMSQYHPLWAAPSAAEFEKGRRAITDARQMPTATSREKDYIAALAVFYDGAPDNHRARTFAYERAMKELSAQYPADREASIFYSLSLIAAGMIDDDASFAREKEAVAILNIALAAEPKHPGVAHYIIHGYDFPALAPLALPAARRYAGIAPASAHAQHMPSHIFTRLGLWSEAIEANLRAEAAAREYARRNRLPGSWDERLHAFDYLVYAYLQTAQDGKAIEILKALDAIERVDPPNFKAAYTFAAVPARLAVERKRWDEAASLSLSPNARRALSWDQFRWADAHIHFARGIGAAHLKNVLLVKQEIAALAGIRAQLSEISGNYDWGQQVEIQRQILSAWLEAIEARRDTALELMRKAADLDDATEKHPVTPGQILPAREQLAELLLASGQPANALVEFERTLERQPARFNSIYGAARSARQAGNLARARGWYAALLKQSCLGDDQRPELQEASSFLGQQQPSKCSAPSHPSQR